MVPSGRPASGGGAGLPVGGRPDHLTADRDSLVPQAGLGGEGNADARGGQFVGEPLGEGRVRSDAGDVGGHIHSRHRDPEYAAEVDEKTGGEVRGTVGMPQRQDAAPFTALEVVHVGDERGEDHRRARGDGLGVLLVQEDLARDKARTPQVWAGTVEEAVVRDSPLAVE